ncbi:AAA family ATPase [Nocardia sp. NPDC005366]|uniref:bifunctional aminoglycoside phosphotransferase/ATP-binding protein n=1 Tax=Nocardia sp. NPDC005366 TaxID=3156878 RepID=UPI0033AD40D0
MNVVGSTPARIHETHTGIVTLCGERAFKVKKPIATDFLDFSTQELRERACARELELNRRIAPDVYLGIAHLVDPTSASSEPVLVMRRMPEDRRLSNLVNEPAWDSSRLSSLVHMLARFHDDARRGPDIDAEGTPAALRDRWLSLLRPLADQSAELVDRSRLARIEHLALRFLEGRAPLFAQRIADGEIVDGHGDLLSQDIFDLPDGFRVLDCLDFDDRLRFVDRLDDIAFLAMDLEFLGHPDLGAALLAEYRRTTGDSAPVALTDHFIAYRALVRAKVDLIRHSQGDDTALDRARRHLAITEQHVESAAIRLVLIGGLPGTGKSTAATELAAATGAVVLSSDHLRRELLANHEIAGDAGSFGTGLYSAASKSHVYRELRARARALLGSGRSVILDASWTDETERRHARELADAVSAELIALECVCPREIAEARIGARHNTDSDATAEIAAAIAATGTSWPDAVRLDTARPLERTVADAMRAWLLGAQCNTTVSSVRSADATTGVDAAPGEIAPAMG